jgi:hypothetical protein
MAPYPRGGGFHRGRGRGRGDWSSERGRGRGPYMDDRGDRYPRSRSQEGRWGRDRDERDRMDRMDRYADPDTRRDIRDDRDPRERELFRNKLEARANAGHDSGLSSKEVSPPPVAPSASAFGPVPNRGLSVGEGYVSASAATKIPPTAPRAFHDRPPSAGHDPTMPSIGLGKGMMHDGSSIPVGPRAQQPPPPRPSSKQWINPNLKKGPDSPKLMRSPSFVQQRPPLRRGSSQYDHYHDDERRPRSSDAKSEPHYDNRARTNYSAEPGEITVKSERESQSARASMDRDTRPTNAARRDSYRSGPSPTMENMPRFGQESEIRARDLRETPKEAPRRKRSQPIIRAVRFEVPPKPAPVEQNSESDDDDDMADYFDMEIGKTEAELSKLEKPKLPTQVMARFAALSHGSMVKIIGEGEGLLKMVKKLPEAVNKRVIEKIHDPTPIEQATKDDVEMADAVDSTDKVDSKSPRQLHQEVQAEPEPEPEHSIHVKGSEEPVEAAPAPEPAAQVDQETTERRVGHTAEEPGEKINDSSREEAAQTLDKKPDESHVEKSNEQVIENPVEKPVEESIEKPAKETEDNHTEKPVQKAENEDTEMSAAPALELKSGEMDIDEPPVRTASVAPDSQPSPSNKKAMDMPSIASETAPIVSLESQKTEQAPLGTSGDSSKDKSDKDKLVEIPAEANGVQPTQTQMEKPTEARPETTPEKPDDVVPKKPVEPLAEPRTENLTENAEALGHRHVAIEGAPVSVICPNVVLQTTETASKPPSTPSQVDDDETESEDDSFMNLDTVRQYMTTPPIDSLPDYSCMPWDKDSAFLKTLDSSITLDEFVVEHLDKMHLEKSAEQDHDRKIYKDNYERYLDFTMSNDPAAVKSRGKFSVSTGIEITGTVTPEPKHEGSGRGRRFATERDLERVLQASMREDEERRERELRMQQEKYRTDKEAIIPNMIWTQEEKDNAKYLDKSGFTPVDRLVSAWRVLPPVNNFTEEEAGLFEKRYLEAPKQWGRVAEAIPHRDFGSCIQYYYMNKKDLNLKEKLKKQPKRRRKGKAKQRSSALVSELGNGDGETEENHDTGENGERRRPRRAAAPTWGFEQPPVDTENSTPNATPGRRGGSAKVDHPEKVDGRKRRRGPKEKEPKAAKANQTLAAAPGSGKGRSRSNSRALNTDGPSTPLPAAEAHRLPGQFEQHPAGMQLPFSVQQQQQQQPIQTLERQQSVAPSSISEVMAAPSLRPDPPPQPAMATFNLAHPPSERKAPTQASSYWSVSESNDFPHLLRSFGSDWTGIAAHMGSKTAVMVSSNCLTKGPLLMRLIGEKLLRPPKGSGQGRVGGACSGG